MMKTIRLYAVFLFVFLGGASTVQAQKVTAKFNHGSFQHVVLGPPIVKFGELIGVNPEITRVALPAVKEVADVVAGDPLDLADIGSWLPLILFISSDQVRFQTTFGISQSFDGSVSAEVSLMQVKLAKKLFLATHFGWTGKSTHWSLSLNKGTRWGFWGAGIRFSQFEKSLRKKILVPFEARQSFNFIVSAGIVM